jgi:hypothetical protein
MPDPFAQTGRMGQKIPLSSGIPIGLPVEDITRNRVSATVVWLVGKAST